MPGTIEPFHSVLSVSQRGAVALRNDVGLERAQARSSRLSGWPLTGFSMRQLIMSRSGATRCSWVRYFGQVFGWVLARPGGTCRS